MIKLTSVETLKTALLKKGKMMMRSGVEEEGVIRVNCRGIGIEIM